MTDSMFDVIKFFDKDQISLRIESRLPHLLQGGVMSFITFRTFDSLPKSVIEDWRRSCEKLLGKSSVLKKAECFADRLKLLPVDEAKRIRFEMDDLWHALLDACHGECVLKSPDLAKIVSDSLQSSNFRRYLLTDSIVMPNHVHLLAAFPENQMLAQCENWKRYTARKINATLGRTGRFWQPESFDHLVRSATEFEYYRQYIAQNPIRAKLQSEHYLHWTIDESRDESK